MFSTVSQLFISNSTPKSTRESLNNLSIGIDVVVAVALLVIATLAINGMVGMDGYFSSNVSWLFLGAGVSILGILALKLRNAASNHFIHKSFLITKLDKSALTIGTIAAVGLLTFALLAHFHVANVNSTMNDATQWALLGAGGTLTAFMIFKILRTLKEEYKMRPSLNKRPIIINSKGPQANAGLTTPLTKSPGKGILKSKATPKVQEIQESEETPVNPTPSKVKFRSNVKKFTIHTSEILEEEKPLNE